MCVEDEQRGGSGPSAGPLHGAVQVPAGEGPVRALLQTAPRKAPPSQQDAFVRQREEHDLEAQSTTLLLSLYLLSLFLLQHGLITIFQ